MTTLKLKSLYRDATRRLPNDADLRVTQDELVTLAGGQSLGVRQEAAVAGLATSSEQALALKIAHATSDWAQALADDLAALRSPSFGQRVAAWFKAATLPPAFAACAISLLAVAAWRMSAPELGATPTTQPVAAEPVLFGGDFDDAIAHQDAPDTLFGGDFDS